MAALATLETLSFDIDDHPLLGAPSLAVGTIHGGSVVNMTPDRCEAEIDLRLVPGQDPQAVVQSIARHIGDDIEIEWIDYKPPVETRGRPSLCRRLHQGVPGRDRRPAGAGGRFLLQRRHRHLPGARSAHGHPGAWRTGHERPDRRICRARQAGAGRAHLRAASPGPCWPTECVGSGPRSRRPRRVPVRFPPGSMCERRRLSECRANPAA